MKIQEVESMVLAISTRRTIADFHNVLDQFERILALVHSDEGITGGYTLTVGWRGRVIREAIEAHLKKALVGRDPFAVRGIWQKMYWGETPWIGRAGATIMGMAAPADSYNLPISPHAGDLMQVHQHLVCVAPNALFLEYIPWGLELFEEPVTVKDGVLQAPQSPGASTKVREEMIKRYRVL